jgi:hypothetical protein
MKAITIHQPWAELIMQGRKQIELRKRNTGHRGLLVIRASKETPKCWLAHAKSLCEKYGLDLDDLQKDALIGTVELVKMITFTEDLWEKLRPQHLNDSSSPGKWKGWRLRNPRRLLQPIQCRSLPGMFQLPELIVEQLQWTDGSRLVEHKIES